MIFTNRHATAMYHARQVNERIAESVGILAAVAQVTGEPRFNTLSLELDKINQQVQEIAEKTL